MLATPTMTSPVRVGFRASLISPPTFRGELVMESRLDVLRFRRTQKKTSPFSVMVAGCFLTKRTANLWPTSCGENSEGGWPDQVRHCVRHVLKFCSARNILRFCPPVRQNLNSHTPWKSHFLNQYMAQHEIKNFGNPSNLFF